MRVLAVAVVAVLALLPAASAAPAPAWRVPGVGAAGTLQLPPSWVNFTRQTPALRRQVAALAAREPRVAPLLYALPSRMSPFVKLLAADLARRSVRQRLVTNVSVLAQRSSATLDGWTAVNVRAPRRQPTVLKPFGRRT